MPRRIEKIREAGVDELLAQEKDLTEMIFRLRFQLSTGQAEALKRLREAKKDLARVKTLVRAQGMVPAGAAAAADAARGHRLRHRGSQHDLRGDWREVLGLPGRERAQEGLQDSEGTRNHRGGVNGNSREFGRNWEAVNEIREARTQRC